jgi:hypothetical protein
MPTVSLSQTGPTTGALANPFFSYPNPSLWYGHVPIYNPPFPPLQPQHYMVPPIMPALPTQSVEYPMIAEWLTYCDNHPQRSGEDFSSLMPKFDDEGFRRLYQLTGDRITVEKLSEWLGIRKGTADLILRYAEEDIVVIRAGVFHPFTGHGQNIV